MSQIAKDAHIMTDEAKIYTGICKEFASHSAVTHSANEYVSGNTHTNTIGGFFKTETWLNRNFHHVGSQRLNRYVTEFDFRYNTRKATDCEHSNSHIKGIVGRRLTYRRTERQQVY